MKHTLVRKHKVVRTQLVGKQRVVWVRDVINIFLVFNFLFQLNDKIAEFEQEKFEMQKQHTQNIQELLDETNDRLQKMETEYNQQNTTTVSQATAPFYL